MTNPLLTSFTLPPFSAIKPEHVVPAVTEVLSHCRAEVEKVVAQGAPYTWDNLVQPLAETDDRLSRIFSPVSHLNAVKNSPELREAYEQTLPLLSEYSTWVGQHEGLYQAYRNLKEGDQYAALDLAQKKAVDNALRDFELSGIGLPKDKQQRYGEIAARLSELGSAYSNNVLDATMGWSKLITDESELAGMPESALAAAKAQAEAKEQEGWLLTLDIPSYLPVMTYCDNAALREEMYRAYATRASDQGPNAGKWDNGPIMAEELALRHELAQLLGFDSYADKSLATKMAQSPSQVIDFLNDLAERARPQGEKELEQLRAFARKEHGVTELNPWDLTYYGEKQKQHLYTISDEQLRPYFPEERAVAGLFEVVKRIYGITAKQRNDVEVYHPDVKFFDLFDETGEFLCAQGNEFGATTGRRRRTGWLDAVAVRRAVQINSLSGFCMTKLDVLDGLKEVKICVAYRMPDGREVTTTPLAAENWEGIEPIYETLPGWSETTFGVKTLEGLPQAARDYIKRVEEVTGVPIDIISTGPDRSETMILRDPFDA